MSTLNVQEWRRAGLNLRKGENEAHGLRKSTYCCRSNKPWQSLLRFVTRSLCWSGQFRSGIVGCGP